MARYLWEDQYHLNLGQVTYCHLQNENGNSIPSHPSLGYKELISKLITFDKTTTYQPPSIHIYCVRVILGYALGVNSQDIK